MTLQNKDWVAIVILLLFAASLRIIGISYGQPDPQYASSTHPQKMLHYQTPMQPDEYLSVAIPMEMLLKNRLNPQFFEYPTFIVNTNFVLFALTGAASGAELEDRSGETLRVYAPFELYVMSRMYSVFGSILIVACAYAIMLKIAGRFAALSAGLLAATSYTLVQHTHYIKPELLSTGWMILTIWLSFTALQTANPKYSTRFYILAGACTGLAATTRYNAFSIVVALGLVGLVLLFRHRRAKMLFTVLSSWVLIVIVFILGTPYAAIEFEAFVEAFRYITGQFLSTGANVPEYFLTSPFEGLFFLLRYIVIFGLGIPAAVMILFGLYSAWSSRPPLKNWLTENTPFLFAGIIFISILAYLVVAMRSIRPGHSDNLTVLIVPQYMLLASLGANWLYQRFQSTVAGVLILLLFVLMPLVMSVQVTRMFSQPDTRQQLQAWIYDHLPADSTIVLNGAYNVPLDAADYQVSQDFDYVEDLSSLASVDYLIMSDALIFDVLRSNEIVPQEIIDEFLAYQQSLDATYTAIVSIERKQWLGSDIFMNTASYWHNPALTVYCLNESSCAKVQ